jgi:polysaccharide biosynthesis protein PslH
VKVLFVCHRFPFPPRRGGKIRPFNIIRHLAKSHEVTVASVARSREEARTGQGLSSYCARYLMGMVTPRQALFNMVQCIASHQPLSMGYFFSRQLKQRIAREIAENHFDLIMVHCSSVAQYVEHVTHIPRILDFGDMDSQKWMIYRNERMFPINRIFGVEGRRLLAAEKALAASFDYCTCTTRNEKETLDNYGTNAKTAWFPNGVDFGYFNGGSDDYDPDTICFVGRMDYYPNQLGMVDFCREVLPLVRQQRPKTRLFVVGAEPSRTIRKLGRIPGVIVTGTVADVRPFLRRAAVTVAPLQIARGTQNKILESLAMGVPVVTTEAAAAGVDAIPGEQLLTARTHQEYAEAVLRLLSDPAERRRFSEKSRARMLSHHNWDHSMRILDEIIEDCLRLHRAAR